MTTMKFFIGKGERGEEKGEKPNAPARVFRFSPLASRSSNYFFRRQLARVVFEHYGDAVLHRIGEAVCLADEFLPRFYVNERPLADRAHQDIEQLGIHSKVLTTMKHVCVL